MAYHKTLAVRNTLFVMRRTGGRELRLFLARQKFWIDSKGHQEGALVCMVTLKITLGILYLVSHAIESNALTQTLACVATVMSACLRTPPAQGLPCHVLDSVSEH